MKFILVIFLYVVSGSIQAQHDPEKIYWQEEPLTWKDFRAQPVKNSPYKANTNAGLSYSWSLKKENEVIELQYEVFSFFNPEGSWVFPESKSEYLLAHEQLHFDITELHARKLRKELEHVSVNQLEKNPKEVLNSFYKRIEKERAAMQQRYDRETNHSINKEAEAKWQEFVREELEMLSNYQA